MRFLAVFLLAALIRTAPAQDLPVIGYLGAESAERVAARLEAFRRGLAEMNYAEGRNVGTLGWHRLSITENGLRTESEAGLGELRFEGVERIAEAETFAFVYVSAVMALVIPKQRIARGRSPGFSPGT